MVLVSTGVFQKKVAMAKKCVASMEPYIMSDLSQFTSALYTQVSEKSMQPSTEFEDCQSGMAMIINRSSLLSHGLADWDRVGF